MTNVKSAIIKQPFKAEKGFTLLEVIVAMFIFAVAIAAMLKVMGEGARNTAYLEKKFFAQLTAHNALVLSTLGDPSAEGNSRNGGYEFSWQLTQYPTENESMQRYEMTVEHRYSKQPLSHLVAFRGTSAKRNTETNVAAEGKAP